MMNQEIKQLQKSVGIEQLKTLALAYSRTMHPTLPEYARTIKSYSDRTANGLTKCIIAYLTLSGHQARRISCTGRYLDRSIVVSDVTGAKRRIGSGQWIPSSGQPGTADISATVYGRSVKIEVKKNDHQSAKQILYQDQVNRAGGLYWICRTFDEFLELYHSMV